MTNDINVTKRMYKLNDKVIEKYERRTIHHCQFTK